MVEGRLELTPQPRLVAGTWREEGVSGPRSGLLAADHLEFLGGQGGRPSLGGRLVLETEGRPVYRIRLPLTVLEPLSDLPVPVSCSRTDR